MATPSKPVPFTAADCVARMAPTVDEALPMVRQASRSVTGRAVPIPTRWPAATSASSGRRPR
jgi:hypothetical protein